MLIESTRRRIQLEEAFKASINRLNSLGKRYTQASLLGDINMYLSSLPEASVANIGLTTEEKEIICSWYVIKLVLAQNSTLNHN